MVFKAVLKILVAVQLIIPLNACIIDPTINEKTLLEVWNSEKAIKELEPYYDFYLNGIHFKGRRDWNERWLAIKNATDYSNKKVLDLGSHVGINSIFISKYLPIKSLVSADKRPLYIDFHRKLMSQFGQSYKIIQVNFETDDYETKLGYDYDTVVCLSLLRWVKKDKQRFLNYLSRFSEVVFEGHPKEADIETFRQIGFPYHKVMSYTSSHIAYYHIKNRPIIIFSKKPFN